MTDFQAHSDILIIGAGLSGIGAACHLARKNPDKRYIILESRSELGGTWSLFKYPGIRSDSDMYTFGYSFKEWNNPKSFADAPSILDYLKEAATEHNVNEQIRYNQRVLSFNFNSEDHLWTVTAENTKTKEQTSYFAQFIFSCSGYYNYEKGYTPDIQGINDFQGPVIHPQKWPSNFDATDKNIVVIGSGATAVTIVPKLAETAEKVTMLQRSPTYVGALPNRDKIAHFIKRILPKKWAFQTIRFKNVLFGMIFFYACRWFPEAMKKFIVKGAQKELGDFPADPNFTPHYNPWVQRFCIAPDADFFKAIKSGKADVVTNHIERIEANGIRLKNGDLIEADVVITATGLNLLPFGGVSINLNNQPFDLAKSFVYKGLMLSELPNFFVFVGYTNASWTLKSDLTSEYISRVLKYMDKKKLRSCVPHVIESNLLPTPLMNLDSGYLNRSAHLLPSQGNKSPWRVYQNYFLDYRLLRLDPIADGRMKFN